MKTKCGSIRVGYRNLQGEIKQAVTIKHTATDVGHTFTDNFGRTYIYTQQGLIY
jgi:hypothetical protein